MTFILPTINLTGLLVAFVPCVLIGLAMMWIDRRKPEKVTYKLCKPYSGTYYRPIKKPESVVMLPGDDGGKWEGEFEIKVHLNG